MSTPLSTEESEWIDALVHEAERDLVFLWYITNGRLGGPKYSSSELASAVERVSKNMLAQGCIVGFGNPDSDGWDAEVVPGKTIEERSRHVAELWVSDPKHFEFLVFARRQEPISGVGPSA